MKAEVDKGHEVEEHDNATTPLFPGRIVVEEDLSHKGLHKLKELKETFDSDKPEQLQGIGCCRGLHCNDVRHDRCKVCQEVGLEIYHGSILEVDDYIYVFDGFRNEVDNDVKDDHNVYDQLEGFEVFLIGLK